MFTSKIITEPETITIKPGEPTIVIKRLEDTIDIDLYCDGNMITVLGLLDLAHAVVVRRVITPEK